jgi:hypothetical protein
VGLQVRWQPQKIAPSLPTIEIPQIRVTRANNQNGPSKVNPINAAHAPETIIMSAVVDVRPKRSDSSPPPTQPIMPVEIAVKVSKEAMLSDAPPCDSSAARLNVDPCEGYPCGRTRE